MTRPQKPIGSGFGARSTAREVVEGIDLTGRLAVVTGGYSGIGLETTRALAGAGARVVVPARRPEEAREALKGLDGVEVESLDLADLDDVAAFADRFLASGRSVDVLIGNAGVMACPHRVAGPGWEYQFATNHLGHFALANRLWPALAHPSPTIAPGGDAERGATTLNGRPSAADPSTSGGARVVSVSSSGHHGSAIRWDDPWFARGYDRWAAYSQSKTANVLFAVEADRRGADTGVRAFALHPGAILTPLQRHMAKEEMVANGWIDEEGRVADPRFKTAEQGAATQVWAATSPRLAGMGGVYCEDVDVAVPAGADPELPGVADHAVDPEQAERLWRFSAELTGVDAFA
jgi:NAD(P)-dependent dehydrogenase (short-subunit alcohol dehydrogenase family)